MLVLWGAILLFPAYQIIVNQEWVLLLVLVPWLIVYSFMVAGTPPK